MSVVGDKAQFNLPQPASEILRADDSDTVYLPGHRPWRAVPLGRARPARAPERRGAPPSARCGCAMPRCAATSAWPTSGCACRGRDTLVALVQVAETREKRSVLATEIIKGVMLPQFVILPLAVLLVYWRWRGHPAAEPAGGTHPRAQPRRPLAAGRPHRAARSGAAGVRSTTCSRA